MGIRNVSIDYCKYVGGSSAGSLLFDILLKNGETNMNQPCPLKVIYMGLESFMFNGDFFL